MSKVGLQVWEKQPGERDKRWEAFQIYRDMPSGERTLAKVGAQLGKSETLMERWSAEDAWRSRVDEYDQFLDRTVSQEARLAGERAKREMLERHTNVSVYVQNHAVARLQQMTDEDWGKVPISQTVDIFIKMAHQERLARGLPSDTIEVVTPERLKQRQIIEARLFLDEMKHDFPILSERVRLEIVCESFEVTPGELGFDEDALDDDLDNE